MQQTRCALSLPRRNGGVTIRDASRWMTTGRGNRWNAIVAKDLAAIPEPGGIDGQLAGWQITVKDNICTTGSRTTCASKMLEREPEVSLPPFMPQLESKETEYTSPYEATVVSLLRSAGAQIVGKTNMDEFGMGSSTTHSIFGPTLNPAGDDSLPLARTAGGSSGGAAAAVASCQCRVALGTDTGGSVRLPAAYCGVVGFKPSYGLLSRFGVVAYASSLDTVGILARSVIDVTATFAVLDHFDEKDPTAIPESYRQQARQATVARRETLIQNLSNLRIGIAAELFPAELSTESAQSVRDVVTLLQGLGASVQLVSLPNLKHALGAYYVLSSAEAASNLARYDGMQYGFRAQEDPAFNTVQGLYSRTRTAAFGDEVKKRILIGNYALNADAYQNYFLKAQALRRAIRSDFDAVFAMPNVLSTVVKRGSATVDIVLAPSAISSAPLLTASETETHDAGLGEYVQDVVNVPASLAGLPAISLPTGRDKDDMPIAVQMIGQWGSDNLVLQVAKQLEQILQQR